MDLDEKKVLETCKTILSSADLNTITEKKVRRQVEEELDLEDKILDGDPYKSIVKEIVNKIINDLQQKNESSHSPPQTKKTGKTTAKSTSTNKKPRKTEAKSKESSKVLEDSLSSSKPLNNNKARSEQESSPISKTQAGKSQNKISKTYGGSRTVSSKPTDQEEQLKKTKNISKVDDNKSSSNSNSAKSNIISKSSKETGKANKFKTMKLNKEEEVPSEEESDSALSTKKTTKRVEAKNKEKQKPNMPRSRVKRKINASSDTDNDNKSSIKSDSVPVKGSDLEEPALPPLKQPKQIKTDLSSDEDEESNSVKERSTEEGQSHHKTDTVEDGVYLKDEQNIDDIDVESDNTIKDDGGAGLKMIPGPDVEDRNSESIGEVEQKLNAESTSPKRTINSADDNSCEDDKPQKKKRKAGKNSAKSVNDKSANDNSINNKSVNNKTTNEKDDKRIKNLKSFITKCGVRKNWTKELADCNTDSSKIRKLKQILMDLGVEGRPTLEKCKKVKMKLELEAELGAMDVDNIISDDVKETRKARASRGIFNPVRRRVSRVTQSSPECDDSSSKDVHSDSE